MLQEIDDESVSLKVDLQRAQTEKIGADMINNRAEEEYRALLEHSNNLPDFEARDALSPELNRLASERTTITRRVSSAMEAVQNCQMRTQQLQQRRATAQAKLDTATRRWESIRKQIEDLNR